MSDDEEDSDCEVMDIQRMRDGDTLHRFNDATGHEYRIMMEQIKNLIYGDPMYIFILFAHLTSKVIEHTFLITYAIWFGTFQL